MVLKCCVTACKSNYASEKEKVPVYRLPFDPEERQRWIKAIPRDNKTRYIQSTQLYVQSIIFLLVFQLLKVKAER